MTIEGALFVFGLMLLAFAGWLRRTQKRWRRLERLERDWSGPSFDATALIPKLQRVREDYVRIARSHSPAPYHEQLITRARQAIRALPFFHKRAEL